jgi:hypothetical protein
VTTEYIRDAQDYTLRLKRQLLFKDYDRGKANHVPNSTGSYLSFLFGAKECGEPCIPPPVLNLSPPNVSLAEGDAGDRSFEYTVTRTGSRLPCSVSWAVTGSGTVPAVASDFIGNAFPAGVETFGIGEFTKQIYVDTAGDIVVEGTKQFTVTLSSPTSATIGVGTATGTIVNDDFPILDLSFDVSHPEGNTGITSYTYTVTRTGTLACSVNWAVTGSATQPSTIPAIASDFDGDVLPSGVVTFALGDTTKSIVINVLGNSDPESDKEFTVTLSSPTSATIGVGTALGTILNDD